MKNSDDLSRVICVLPKLDNPRIIRQQGAFFLFGFSNGIKEHMAIAQVSKIQMKIPKEHKRKILNELDHLGINKKYLFPEIDNVARYLKEYVKGM